MQHFPTPEERHELGRARRKQVTRQHHGPWKSQDRPKTRQHDPIVLLESSVRGRIPSLVKIKYALMAASPFGFFRGAVPIMAADLSVLPNTGIHCQLCGDAHVRNLGAFAAPDGRLVFDINDFDETIQGPFEWDVKRLATSLVLAGREIGGKASNWGPAVLAFVEQYRKSIQMFAKMPVVEIARYQVHRLQRIQPVSEVLLKAERATPMHSVENLTELPEHGGQHGHGDAEKTDRIFKEKKPMLTRLTGTKAREVLASLKDYRETLTPSRQHFLAQYRPIDVAFKVVGTGSVGLRDYVIYFEGNGPGDPLFLQIKEETDSAYAPYIESNGRAAAVRHHGQRVVQGQQAMQFQSDPFLGWTTIAHRDYLVRQLSDYKGSLELDELKGEGLIQYGIVCGELLARGHARSGDPCVIAGYLGNRKSFGDAILDFAEAYADQTKKDWEVLLQSKHAPPKHAPRKQAGE